MPHTKKKVGVLTTATSSVGAAVTAISAERYVEGAVFLGISAILFLLYERFQVEEVSFALDDARKAAEFVSEESKDWDQMSKK